MTLFPQRNRKIGKKLSKLVKKAGYDPERLEEIYGQSAQFTLCSSAGIGTNVRAICPRCKTLCSETERRLRVGMRDSGL